VPCDLYRFADSVKDLPTLTVNGRNLPIALEQGFAMVRRTRNKGDVIELNIPMPVRQVMAHPAVRENNQRVALQRGPLVYCTEGPDNDKRALNLVLPPDTILKGRFDPEILGGVGVVESATRSKFVAVPYFAWANRGMGEMRFGCRAPLATRGPGPFRRCP
jgi:DUF1680 family protein